MLLISWFLDVQQVPNKSFGLDKVSELQASQHGEVLASPWKITTQTMTTGTRCF